MDNTTANSCVINPIRNVDARTGATSRKVYWNPITYELFYDEISCVSEIWDTRGSSSTPNGYRSSPGGLNVVKEFKNDSDVGSPFGTGYVILETWVPWVNTSGGICWQQVYGTADTAACRGTVKKRYETGGGTSWSAWFAFY